MAAIETEGTIKTSNGLIVQYLVPKTDDGWRCAGANLQIKGDQVELTFIAAPNSDNHTKVDLPAENAKRPNLNQVHIPLHGLNKFSLVIDGKHKAAFILGRTKQKDGEQDSVGNGG